MKFIDLFAGIGGIRLGMEMAGDECVGFCEFDKFAVASYTSMHLITDEQRDYLGTLSMKQRQKEILKEEYRNGEWYAKDIREITGDTMPGCDCWCFGAPCFVGETLVTTHRGLIPIKDVSVGDMVLTHRDRFRTVIKKMINYKNNIYTMKVQGCPKIEMTGNHPFLVRYGNRVWNNKKRGYEWEYTEPEWKSVEDFNGKEFIKFPNNNSNSNQMGLSDVECWLIGRYIADGYIQEYERKNRNKLTRRVVFCIGNHKIEEFKGVTKDYLFTVSNEGKSCTKYISLDKRLFGLCHECGRRAENKMIPRFIMDLPPNKLEKFLDGYLSGDGYIAKNGTIRATSVSKTLIYQLGECVFKVYHTPFSISCFSRPSTYVIEGRTVNQKDSWNIQFNKEIRKQNNGRVINNELWMPVKEITRPTSKKEIVYNLEVEDDHSYTVYGLAAHNCQSFSVAGKRAGLEGQSGLIREVFRIIWEIREEDRPEWLIYENVKGMFSSNKGFDYLAILSEMDELGYDIQWQNFNSRYYVPQNRERVYTVGHLRRYGSAKIFPVEGTDGKISLPIIKRIAHANKFRRYMQTYDKSGIVETLDTGCGGGHNPYVMCDDGRIRKLTPKECWRLQGFPDEMCERAAFVNSDSQLYKQAGNSVTVPVVYEIANALNMTKIY